MFVLSLCFLCEVVASFLPFTIPGSILAMAVLLILLFLKVIKPKQLSAIKNFLLAHMALFFVPAGVEIMNYIEVIKQVFIPFAVIILFTTPLVFVVTGLTVQFWANKFIKQKGDEEND